MKNLMTNWGKKADIYTVGLLGKGNWAHRCVWGDRWLKKRVTSGQLEDGARWLKQAEKSEGLDRREQQVCRSAKVHINAGVWESENMERLGQIYRTRGGIMTEGHFTKRKSRAVLSELGGKYYLRASPVGQRLSDLLHICFLLAL